MVTLFKQDKIKTFEYFYFFVMVIYMAQMNNNTARMITGMSSPFFPFFLPIILTLVLLDRNKVKFDDKRLIRILLVFAIWTVLLFVHKPFYDSSQYSYYFFLFYSIVIAYIHVQVFGKKMLPLYEHIMVRLCFIGLVLWGFAVIIPGSAAFFRSFPECAFGRNVFYIFKWMDSSVREESIISNGILRNAGCSWEPGRFAIMVLLALFCNLVRNGIKFKGNTEGIILLLSIASTQSTTGYIGALILYSIFSIKKISPKYILGFSIIVIPVGYQLIKLDFMQEKVESQLDLDAEIKKTNEVIDYANKARQSNEYLGSMARFPSMYFETINIKMDPILGYGRNPGKSYFSQRISGNFVLTTGLLQIFGAHGIPLGILLYIILFKSSVTLGRELNIRKGALFIVYLVALTGYNIFTVPIFMAFWFYGIFRKEEDLIVVTSEDRSENTEETTGVAVSSNNASVLPS